MARVGRALRCAAREAISAATASKVSRGTIAYDPLGRIAKTTSGTTATDFLYDGSRLIAEYNSATGALLRSYVHGVGSDDPLLWMEGGPVVSGPGVIGNDPRWLYRDRQGSVIGTAGANGIITPYTYGPYGEPQSWAGSRFRYTGQIALPEAQLYHYKVRAYDPVMGRFLQTDPIGYGDGMNIYAYVHGDPVNGVDPEGTSVQACPENVKCVVDAGGAKGGGSRTGNTVEEVVVTGGRDWEDPKDTASNYVLASLADSRPTNTGQSDSTGGGSQNTSKPVQPPKKACPPGFEPNKIPDNLPPGYSFYSDEFARSNVYMIDKDGNLEFTPDYKAWVDRGPGIDAGGVVLDLGAIAFGSVGGAGPTTIRGLISTLFGTAISAGKEVRKNPDGC